MDKWNEAKSLQDKGKRLKAAECYEELLKRRKLGKNKGKILSEYGRLLLSIPRFERAKEIYNILLKHSHKEKDRQLEGRAYYGLALIHRQFGDLTKGLEELEKAYAIFQEEKIVKCQAKSALKISSFKGAMGNFDEVTVALDHAKELYSKFDDNKVGLAKCLSNKALLHYYRGEYSSALEDFNRSKAMFKELNSFDGIGTTENHLGVVYKATGDYNSALGAFQRALDVFAEIDDQYGIALSNHNFGDFYTDNGNFKLARYYYEQSREIREKIQDSIGLCILYGDIAILEFHDGDFKEAQAFFRKSLDWYNKTGSENELVEKLCYFSRLLIEQGKIEEARQYLVRSETLSKKHNSRSEYLMVLLHQGIIELSEENLGVAQEKFFEVYNEAQKLGFFKLLINTCIFIAEILLTRYSYQSNFRMTPDIELLDNALKYVEEALVLANREKLYPMVVNCKIIKANFHLTKQHGNTALQTLKKALKVCNEMNLKTLGNRVIDIMAQIKERMSLLKTFGDSDEGKYLLRTYNAKAITSVLQSMKVATLQDVKSDHVKEIVELDDDSMHFIVFKHGNSGPVILFVDPKLPLLGSQSQEELASKLGVFLMMGIGQGNYYHTGLFGPLPVAIQDRRSIIYASVMGDVAQEDKRIEGKNYCLFCLVYRMDIERFLNDRSLLEVSFQQKLESIKDISEINSELMRSLKDQILEMCQYCDS